jgi:prepilin signal peptidase PulO-like enzyme (type II secretory pathway)
VILPSALVGLLVGSFLNWAGDHWPRFASSSTSASFTSTPRPVPVLWHLMTSSAYRRSLVRLQKSSWLGVTVEGLTVSLFVYLWKHVGLSWELLLLALACSFLLLIAMIDLKHRLIPNVLIYPAAVMTLLLRAILPGGNPLTALLGGTVGFLIFLLVALVQPGSMGGGDVKLAALIGMIVGFPQALWALALGILAGGIAAIVLLITRLRGSKSHIPYAPFLCFGAMIVLLYNPIPSIFPL